MSDHTLVPIGRPTLQVTGGPALQTLATPARVLQGGLQGPPGPPGDGAPPTGTFAQMRALTGMVDGFTYQVTNYGKGGSLWHYAAADAEWYPTSACAVFENRLTRITGLKQTAEQVLLAIPIEAGLLKGKRVRLLWTASRDGTTDTLSPRVRFGATGTIADALIATTSIAPLNSSTLNRGYEMWWVASDNVTLERVGGQTESAFSGAGYTLATFQQFTVPDLDTAGFLSICCTMSGVTNTPQLGYVVLEILP